MPGKELTCAVIGDTALGVIDIVSKSSSWYDYTSKYAPGGSQHILPAEIPADVYRELPGLSRCSRTRRWAAAAFRAPISAMTQEGTGELILLEVNTQPGMTGTSLVPELAAHAGKASRTLVTWMVNDASVDR